MSLDSSRPCALGRAIVTHRLANKRLHGRAAPTDGRFGVSDAGADAVPARGVELPPGPISDCFRINPAPGAALTRGRATTLHGSILRAPEVGNLSHRRPGVNVNVQESGGLLRSPTGGFTWSEPSCLVGSTIRGRDRFPIAQAVPVGNGGQQWRRRRREEFNREMRRAGICADVLSPLCRSLEGVT